MNIRACFLILSVCLLMSGCRGNVKVTDGDRLCVDKILDTDIQCTMEDMGYKADVILLETSDSVLLPNNPVIKYVSDSDIYISADRILYRFDNGGKFKNKIGRRGGG
ncbi:MAG: 6-bladed beta-propeller, partial [Muribaculaceae bacterium]|nr:6-bladed beta-propeller [Muribaculaceae bacterium]